MAYPIMPLFIILVLKADKWALGLIEGVALALVNFMQGWSGFHSDRTGKRTPYIQVGYLTSGLSKPIIGLAYIWPTVLLGRVLDRFGKGVRTTARDALLADSVDKKDYGKAYGLHQGMDTGGAFTGVMITVGLLWLWGQSNTSPDLMYRRILYFAAIPGFIAWLITFTLKDKPQAPPAAGAKPRTPFAWSMLTKGYWRAVIITSVFALANSSDTFLLLRAGPAKGGGVGMTALLVVLAYALYNLVFTFFSYPVGKLSDKVGRWPTLMIGWILYAVVYLGFGYANPTTIWFLFAIYGVSIGAVTAVNKALVADNAPKAARGSAMGVFQVVTGVATLIASPAMGYVWDRWGPRVAFDLGAGLALLAALLIPVLGALKKPALAS